MTRPRGNRHRLRGVVVRDKADKTITIEVVRRFRHPRYGKMVRRHSCIAAHDETNDARVGDMVEIVSCRPMSRTKRYRVLQVIERSVVQQLVGQPPDRAEAEANEKPGAPAPAPAAEPTAGVSEPAAEAPAPESTEPTPPAGAQEPTEPSDLTDENTEPPAAT
ncbi:MAG: 30S ribosomal protein S17 [Planctomycetes bacterium]|nr:30S ribosomal protein S17 [Planctomycetota bacterium]